MSGPTTNGLVIPGPDAFRQSLWGVKRDLARGMMRILTAATTARRSLMAQSIAPRLRFQIFRFRRRPARPELGLDTIHGTKGTTATKGT